ncbi:RdgB/HAM1 family non-canonical purine NTP pyrophosphatase [bacterium]|nr:RdgB/HAM1 family non-canonical purine NTP pyrophosphatase [bacterium]
MKIVLATANPHKLQEIKAICGDCEIEFALPASGFNPIENGSTFEENSYIKAKEAYRVSKSYSLADDSGLCVDALNGAPGLFSARYAGSQDEKIEKLLNELKDKSNRKAKFVCCMTLLNENGEIAFQTIEECGGEIVKERKGINGFGYDPIFKVDGYSTTMAELSEKEKNTISHRAKALRKVLEYIRKNLI